MADSGRTTSHLSRREFLQATALAGASITLSKPALGLPLASEAIGSFTAPTPGWVDKPMRWAQLTLVEDDPGKFDLQFWLDYFKRTRSDAVCLSAGGCVAYYPTNVPSIIEANGLAIPTRSGHWSPAVENSVWS